MPETFLILLAGGTLLAAAISDANEVTLHWLRLCGILGLVMAGLSLFFALSHEPYAALSPALRNVQRGLLVTTTAAILAQLALAQTARRRAQRIAAGAGFALAVLAGSNVLHEMMLVQGTAVRFPPKLLSVTLQALACAGVAASCGLVLMDMLLGHAYLTASKMTIAPFRRLNVAVGLALGARAVLAVGVVLLLQRARPVPMLWGAFGLLILTRWLVGLAVPAVFVYMAHDCIQRRSTQSATGILYVAGVLVFIGELIAVYLVRATGLPF